MRNYDSTYRWICHLPITFFLLLFFTYFFIQKYYHFHYRLFLSFLTGCFIDLIVSVLSASFIPSLNPRGALGFFWTGVCSPKSWQPTLVYGKRAQNTTLFYGKQAQNTTLVYGNLYEMTTQVYGIMNKTPLRSIEGLSISMTTFL